MDARNPHLFEAPCLIGAASEGGREVFTLPYLLWNDGVPAQSAQFYKQLEVAGGREKVYSIGPGFRAKNPNTHRHSVKVSSRH